MNPFRHQLLTIGLLFLLLCVGGISCYAQPHPTSPAPLIHDALIAPDFTANQRLSTAPGYLETSEYMIGSVAVGVVFLESNGAVDPSTEDWNTTEESQVTNKVQDALNWWRTENPSAGVTFTVDWNYGVPTSYEPITRPHSDQSLWISEAMTYLGHSGVNYFSQVRGYINALRNSMGTYWAFAMFIVDSSNDADETEQYEERVRPSDLLDQPGGSVSLCSLALPDHRSQAGAERQRHFHPAGEVVVVDEGAE